MKIIQQTLDKIVTLKRSTKKFLFDMVTTFISCDGKRNFRNLSRYSDYHEKTISDNFKGLDIDFNNLNKELITVVDSKESILSVDSSFIKKSGKKTYGLGNFWDGKNSISCKGLEISTLSLIDVKDNTAYSLDVRQTPSESLDSRIDFYTKQITETKDLFSEVKHIVGDGYYSKITFVNGVTDSDRHFVGKLRKDANLKYYYQGEKTGKKGKPKIYDGKVDLSKPEFEYVCDLEDQYKLYTKIVYSVGLKRKIKLSYKTNGKNNKIYFSTDLELSPQKIHEYYQKRYQIEFLFRDSKNHLGLEDCMSTDQKALNFHFNICMTSLNFAKVEDKVNRNTRNPFSIINIKRRLYNQKMLNLFLFNFDIKRDFDLNEKKYSNIWNYGTISA